MKKGTKVLIVKVFIILTAGFFLLIFLNAFFFQKAYADEMSITPAEELAIFPQRVLDLVFKPDPLTSSEISEIKNSLQSAWPNSWDYNTQEKWKAIMSMEDDQLKVEILLLWFEVVEQEYLKRIEGKEDKLQSSVDSSRVAILESQKVWALAILTAIRARDKEIADLKAQVEAYKKLEINLRGKIEELMKLLKEVRNAPKGVPQEQVARLKIEYERQISELKKEIERLKGQAEEFEALIKKLRAEIQRLTTWKEPPKSFWLGIGVIEQKRIYGNPFGFVGDSVALHSWPLQATIFEGGVRKFLVREIGGVQIFAGGGLHKTFFGGVGIVVYIKPLDISLDTGVMYFSENLRGDLDPVKGFGGITFEGKWVRGNFRVVPGLRLATLSGGLKF